MKISPFSVPADKIEAAKIRLQKLIKKDVNTGCWLWHGCICDRGYGRFWIYGRGKALAHRVSYALYKGPIKRDNVVDHKCNNPICVNPDHLQQASHSNNLKYIAHRRKR